MNSSKKYSLIDFAREIGRFDMRIDQDFISHHTRESELSLERMMDLGLQGAARIWVFPGSYRVLPGLHRELRAVGTLVDGGWEVGVPKRGNTTLWRRLLDSDMYIVFEAPRDRSWLEATIRRLYAPVVYATCEMSDPCLKFCRKRIRAPERPVLVATGLYRDHFSFCGQGPLFEQALVFMSQRPSPISGYDASQRRNMLRNCDRMLRELPKDLRG